MPPWHQAAVTTGPRVQAACRSQHFHFREPGMGLLLVPGTDGSAEEVNLLDSPTRESCQLVDK